MGESISEHPKSLGRNAENVSSDDLWYSTARLEKAWRYAKNDIRDNFVFDIINHEDIKYNIKTVISNLSNQIKSDLYFPAPLLRIDVPKNEFTVRPGTVISPIDLIVLYALAQQIAPQINSLLSNSAYAYRLNPKSEKSGEALFTQVDIPKGEENNPEYKDEGPDDVDDAEDFPYNWFANWKIFHSMSLEASREYEFIASTDITAFFENISLSLLREMLMRNLPLEKSFIAERLIRLFEFWDWKAQGNLPQAIGLPQGNDVSSFLSNLYLKELDTRLLALVNGDETKYLRYVDDVRIFTSDKNEAKKALLASADVLRTLNLHLQSSKTEIKKADLFFDGEVEAWSNRLDKTSTRKEQKEAAQEFWDSAFDANEIKKWQRPFLQCLRIFREGGVDKAIDAALSVFLTQSSHKLISGTFTYLRDFSTKHSFSEEIVKSLAGNAENFGFHRAYIFRLGAYSRDDSESLKSVAFSESLNPSGHWYSRAAAIFCLHSFALSDEDLFEIHQLTGQNEHPQLLRSAYILLAQATRERLGVVREELALFMAPHQDYLRRYFFSLYGNAEDGKKQLSEIDRFSINSPLFIHNLHKLDLIKANLNSEVKADTRKVVRKKLMEKQIKKWPRLEARLASVLDRITN